MTAEMIKLVGRFQNHGRTTLFRSDLLEEIRVMTNMDLMLLAIKLHEIIQKEA